MTGAINWTLGEDEEIQFKLFYFHRHIRKKQK